MAGNERIRRRAVLAGALGAFSPRVALGQGQRFRIALAGLAHGHASGFLRALHSREDVELVGVSEPDSTVRAGYAERFRLAGSTLFASLEEMLDKTKPHAVAAFTSTYDHPPVVEACAARRLAVMMEKPLAVSMEHAQAIAEAARRGGIPVVVNYETTWYRSHAWQGRLVRQPGAEPIRKMVAMHGHQGPKEIGVGPEFLSWLTDPEKNGAGALFDFGCYGANLMTWLMNNQRPLAVTARVLTLKPAIYPQVDDEATVVLDYPTAQGVIQASWNWPYSRKDLELYCAASYAHAVGGGAIRWRRAGARQEEQVAPEELPEQERDAVSFLKAVALGRMQPGGLSSLANNLIVTQILTAARQSAKSGRSVSLR